MDKLPKFPDGINSNLLIPDLRKIAGDSQFPAYLRMAAMDISSNSYSTVGSILANMCPQDLGSILNSWLRQLDQARGGIENIEEGRTIMAISSPVTFSYLLFTAMVVKAEAGDVKLDPLSAGFQAELMSTFIQAMVISNGYERVSVDMTKFTLTPDFLDHNFDHVISTDNYEAMKYVLELKGIWAKMRKSEALAELRRPTEPKKEELIRAPASVSKFREKKNLDLDLSGPGEKKSAEDSSLGDLEAKLRGLLGG